MENNQVSTFIISEDPLGAAPERIQSRPKRKFHKPGPQRLISEKKKKHIDKQAIAEMLNEGYKGSYIAKQLDVTPEMVSNINTILESKKEEITTFSNHKSMMLNLRQMEANRLGLIINESLSKDLLDNELKPADKINWLKALDIGFSIYFDKLRLHDGKSTSNIAVLSGFMKQALAEV